MRISRANGVFGVEFYDVDVSVISEDELNQARAAQNEHGVIFFRDQRLSPEQHLEFARRWGEIVVNRFFERVEGFEQIAMVRKEPRHKTAVGEEWHTDHSYDQVPAKGSILYARQVPGTGGETLFANMYLAYDSLIDSLKKTLSSLNAVHSSKHVFSKSAIEEHYGQEERYHNHELATQDSIHPIVIVHPDSGKKALYVNPTFTVQIQGWTVDESRPLLDYLYQHAIKPAHVMEFKWEKDSIAFWDNRATWHRAKNNYPTETRIMHRVTIQGSPIKGCGAKENADGAEADLN